MHFGRLSILATISVASFMVNAKAESVHFSSQDFTVTCTGWKTVLDAPAKIPLVGCSVPGNVVVHRYKPKEKCDSDWGQNFHILNKGKAEIECASDAYGAEMESSQSLKHGKIIRGYGWEFKVVGKDGIECKNSDGNKFFLSSKRQVLLNKNH